jgi:hypothetical protein
MQIGFNDEAAKQAAFVLIERHHRFSAPFERLEMSHTNIQRGGENIGSYRITVERLPDGTDN